jgi:hypothetical protein
MRTAAHASTLALALPLTGCLVVGYSSSNGWSIWPGSLVITLLMLLVYFLLRTRH